MNRLRDGLLVAAVCMASAAEVRAQYNPYVPGPVDPYRTPGAGGAMLPAPYYPPYWRRWPRLYPYPVPYPFFVPYPVDTNPYTPAPTQPPAEAPPTDNRARIMIRLPSYVADVWVDDEKMADRLATERLFISPPLEQGHTYTYTIKVRFPRRFENVTEERTIHVRANEATAVDFTRPAAKVSAP